MACPKCNGFMQQTFVYDGMRSERQYRCLNCGLYVKDKHETMPCPSCDQVVCKCWGKKKSKEQIRKETE